MKYVLFICFFAASCRSEKKEIDFSEIALYTADVECRAIAIRERRFDLANEIRFAQDTLSQTKNVDSVRLELKIVKLNSEKEAIISQSQLMADSIKNIIDSLSRNYLKSADSKKQFNDSLNSILSKRGCLNTP